MRLMRGLVWAVLAATLLLVVDGGLIAEQCGGVKATTVKGTPHFDCCVASKCDNGTCEWKPHDHKLYHLCMCHPGWTGKHCSEEFGLDKGNLDPSNFVVVIVASLTLVYAALRASKTSEAFGASGADADEEEDEAGEMHLGTALIFIVVASSALILIFYFMAAMSIFITVVFCFSSTLAFGSLVYPYIERASHSRWSYDVELPALGAVPCLVLVIAPFSVSVVLAWVITKHWIFNNILGFSLCVFFLCNIRLSSIKVATALLSMAFCYDIFWVFLSSHVFGQNVMVKVAVGLDVPMKLQVPLMLSQGPNNFTIIGLGDMVLPGLLICFALRYDINAGKGRTNGYFLVGMVFYAIGLTMCEVVVGTTHISQPAMIYLVPCTLGSISFLAWRRGELAHMWEGLATTHVRIPDEESDDGVRVPTHLTYGTDIDPR